MGILRHIKIQGLDWVHSKYLLLFGQNCKYLSNAENSQGFHRRTETAPCRLFTSYASCFGSLEN